MSVATEIARIQEARDTLRTKGVALGIAVATDNLTQVATKFDAVVDQGTPNASVKEGESYTIAAGYYHGGTVKGVAGGGNYELQAKSVTPTKKEQSVAPDDGYYGLSGVTVNPIPDAYQDVTGVTATASQVLSGAVYVTAAGVKTTGTMQNRGAVTATLDTETTSYTILEGYHNGKGKISLATETKSATPSTSAQTITPTSGKVLSSVTVAAIPSKYADATNKTAAAGDLLAGKTAISWDSTNSKPLALTGTMVNNGAVSETLDTGTTSYTIPVGYHSGAGTVSISTETKSATPTTTAQTVSPTEGRVLSSVTVNAIPSKYADATDKTAAAGDVLSGKTAISWNSTDKKPVSITGTMTNNGAVAPAALAAGGSYTIPAGYHNGSGKVTTKTLAAQTGVDSGKTAVTAATMLTGCQGWVNGAKVTGTMANNGAISGTITGLGSVTGDTSYTIPAGYTSGGTVSLTDDIETQLAAI